MVLMAKSIQAAIRYGLSEFDFLRGPESYKSHWTSSERKIWNLSIYPPGLKNTIYRRGSLLSGKIKAFLKRGAIAALPTPWIERIRTWRGDR